MGVPIKKKPCKGLGKAKLYAGCGKMHYRETGKHGLCIECYPKWVLNTEEGQATIPDIAKRAKIQVQKDIKARDKAKKAILTNWKNKLQTKVQEIARLIDKDLTCLATGKTGQMHGGHLWSKGANTECRFNLHNIHRQCAHSNTYNADEHLMWIGLENEYGFFYKEFVHNLRGQEVPQFSNDAYKRKYKIACSIVNELKQQRKPIDAATRINLRNNVNALIGIYSKAYGEFDVRRLK